MIPDYRIEGFNYVSTMGKEKQWMIDADEALMYNKEKLVHARRVKAYLYDADGKITVVTGQEAKYFMGLKHDADSAKNLEIYGDVHTVFPDGFEVTSDYMKYQPADKRISVPTEYAVRGQGTEKSGETMEFDSMGLEYIMTKALIELPKAVKFVTTSGKDRTEIVSDNCLIYRDRQLAHFDMVKDPKGIYNSFVEINQTGLYARSRNADLNYASSTPAPAPTSKPANEVSPKKTLNYMIAYEDVFIREKDKDNVQFRYSTSGRADFDSKRNLIILTQYPQAYQDNDTVTGDVILMHRDTDVIEVKNSNSFSQGESQEKS